MSFKLAIALGAMMLLSACALPNSYDNPFNQAGAYGFSPAAQSDNVKVLSTGELHYE